MAVTGRTKTGRLNMRYHFLVVVVTITMIIMWAQYDFSNKHNDIMKISLKVHEIEASMDVDIKDKVEETLNIKFSFEHRKLNDDLGLNTKVSSVKTSAMKTVLIWTLPNHDPLMYLRRGNEAFVNRKCKVQNCYITTDETFMDLTEFDVILFNGPEVVDKKNPKLPLKRSSKQNYVFASIESSDYYPICDNRFDGYFNISWTYKLNSDIFYGYIIIKNSVGEIIGPKEEMHWMSINDMKPVDDTVKKKLSSKKKLAAWMVSNCNAPSGRDRFVKNIKAELKKLGTDMTVDVYGNCGTLKCPADQTPQCLQMFEENYYFYFSFENSFTSDYVTEKLLHPLQYFMVPVVYGTANYTRFMPDGIYLNALDLGPKKVAERMLEIIADKEQYYSYFKWMNHYSFHYVEEDPETDFYCKFCEAMNNEELMNKTTVIQKFKEWWNPAKIRPGACPARL